MSNLKTLPLTDGTHFAIVDAEDYERLKHHRWEYYLNGRVEYAQRRKQINKVRKTILLHREVLGLAEGDKKIVDHIDGCGLHNFKENLRLVDHAQNHWNAKKSKKNTSGVRGVYWSAAKKKWKVWIMVRGVRTHLGSFADYDQAVETRRRAEHESYGEFSRLPDHVKQAFAENKTA